jgi:hypothetical protein
MTVLFVFGDMLEEEVSFADRPALLVDFAEDEVSVDDETEVTVLPEIVATTVTRLTLADVLVVDVVVSEVGVGVSELEVDSSVVVDGLLGVGVEDGDGVVVGVGVVDVLLADVLFIAVETEEEDDSAADPVPSDPPARLVETELTSESTAFFSISRSKMFESNQFA